MLSVFIKKINKKSNNIPPFSKFRVFLCKSFLHLFVVKKRKPKPTETDQKKKQ